MLTAQCVSDDQESDIQDCAAVEKLSDLKRAVEDNESPIMRQVFSWLFPFGPAWNAGLLFVLWFGTFVNICPIQFWEHFTSARASIDDFEAWLAG